MKTLAELASLLGVELRVKSDAAHRPIRSVDGSRTLREDALVFAEDEAALTAGLASRAAAVLVAPALAEKAAEGKPLLVGRHPRLLFARAARLLREPAAATGVHPSAVVSAEARLGSGVSVGAGAVIGAGAQIGDGSRIGEGAVVGEGVVLGRDCRVYPRAVLYPGVTLGDRVVVHAGAVLGADGFGYVRDAATGEYLQFPQQGVLIVEDDVEIGANTTIDRGALEETRIGRGTKLDNLVHVGHNCRVGRNVVIAAQTGVSGSSTVGDNAVIGGQVGIGDHAAVGEGVILGGQAGILPGKRLRGPGILFWGTPARPVKEYLRELAALARLSRRTKS